MPDGRVRSLCAQVALETNPAKFEALTAELTILLLAKCETLVAEITHLLAQQRTVGAPAMTFRNDPSKPN